MIKLGIFGDQTTNHELLEQLKTIPEVEVTGLYFSGNAAAPDGLVRRQVWHVAHSFAGFGCVDVSAGGRYRNVDVCPECEVSRYSIRFAVCDTAWTICIADHLSVEHGP